MLPIATTDHALLSSRHQSVLETFLGFRKLPHSCTATEGMCHSSTRPPNVQVYHCTWSVTRLDRGLPMC